MRGVSVRRGGDLVVDAAATLLGRPVRTLGMVLGIVVGVAVGVATSTLATSQQASVLTAFDRQLAGFVALEAQPLDPAVADPLVPLDPRQDAVVSGAPGATVGGELSVWRDGLDVARSRFAPARSVPVFGVTPGGVAAAGARSVAGAPVSTAVAGVGAVWLGEALAHDLGATGADLGTVLVDGRPWPVAGVVAASDEFPSLDVAVLVGSARAQEVWGPPQRARVVADVRRGSAEAAATYLRAVLDPTRTRGLTDVTPPDNRIVREEVDRDLRQAGLVLSALAMVVGAVAVANTLSMAVLQRRSEMGLRTALGWTRARLAGLVLVEAALAGGLATLTGLAVGLVASDLVAGANGWELVLPSEAVWWPVASGLAAAAVGGVSPAVRAGSVAPLEALRG